MILDRNNKSALDSEYRLRRPNFDDRAALRTLAIDIQGAVRADTFEDRWWWRDEVPHCWVAEHVPSGSLAAICGSRRGRFCIEGTNYTSTSICDWYVSSAHKRKGLGRALVQRSDNSSELMYTSAISDSAALGFDRLGWIGDQRYPMLLAPPALVIPFSQFGTSKIETRRIDIDVNSPLDKKTSTILDLVWSQATDRSALMVRDGKHLRQHLRLAGLSEGRTQYQLHVAYESGKPVGWLLTRITARGAVRSIPLIRIAILSDFMTPPNRPKVLRSLIGAAARHMLRRAGLLLGMAGDRRDLRVFDSLGFVSPRSPIVGTRLRTRLATRTMLRLPDHLRYDTQQDLHITFADNDTDLILRPDSIVQRSEKRI